MQALIEHISSLLQAKNTVELAEVNPFAHKENQQMPDESTSVWSFYFNNYSKQNTAEYES